MALDYDDIRARHPVRRILEQRYGVTIKHNKFRCPMHDDKTASANLLVSKKDGRERMHCHVCSITWDAINLVAAKEGLSLPQAAATLDGQQMPQSRVVPLVIPEPKKPVQQVNIGFVPETQQWTIREGVVSPPIYHANSGKLRSYKPELVHKYKTAVGMIYGLVIRIQRYDGSKACLPIRWDEDNDRWAAVGFREGISEPPLYGEDILELRPFAPVLVVEGEKCVDIAQACPAFKDHVIVSWQGGTGQAKHQNFDRLNGREVTFWPDNDEPGKGAMREAFSHCKPSRAYWIEPPVDKKKGWDVADAIAEDSAAGALRWMLLIREDFQPVTVGSAPFARTGDWLPAGVYLDTNSEGGLDRRSEVNVWLALEHHPELKGRASFDVFDRIVLWDDEPLTSYATYKAAHEVLQHVRLKVTADRMGAIIEGIAESNRVNRLADELRALAPIWDGVERDLFVGYAGVEDTPWARAVSRRWMLGLVGRILEPGCQHDGMVVLEGPQGAGKTTLFRELGQIAGRSLHTELFRLDGDRDTMMALAGSAIVELSELHAQRKADQEVFKGLLTSRRDKYRPPYGKHHIETDRVCVFCATTNENEGYLTDPTGNRRFWILRSTGAIDIPSLQRDRTQLWAETVHRWLQGERSQLTPEEILAQEGAADARVFKFHWRYELEQAVNAVRGSDLTSKQPYEFIGANCFRDRSPVLQRALTQAMNELGWTFSKGTTKADRTWRWRYNLTPTG